MTAILHKLYELLLSVISTIVIVMTPAKTMIIAVSILVIADFIVGLLAAKRMNQKIESNKMGKSIMRLFVYALGILFCSVLEQFIITDVPVVKYLCTFIALRESKSFFENIYILTGFDLMDIVIAKLQQMTSKQQEEIPKLTPPKRKGKGHATKKRKK